ncbi:membrane protein [Paraliobacillus quinghaiensis]|uniref:Membrane protein n=1 Tax=Paraliobacillus quinghaiensis TaxID=470815 RepID=A0A917WX44_9BACI|nr:DUF2975 domain-containing protein [Paraliobacillus quinghaiensis]GGM41170.1 membrane protein [Paraliobacillus quinghaiensis]
MNRGSTVFLKIAIFLIGIPVLGLCVLLLPKIAMEAIEQAQDGAMLAYVVFGLLIIMYGSAIPFYVALYQGLLLLSYIDKNQAFSELSVNALRKIKNSAKLIFGLYVVALPLIFIIAEWDDAPGLVLLGMVIAGSSLIVAVFVAVLQRLLQQAIKIKSENDLTV